MKFSVVIPTMWMSNRLSKLLLDLNNSDYVGEIILIDNDANNSKKLPLEFLDSQDKIKIFDFGKNIYVNPAWNIGVDVAREEHICICNDDVNFDVDILFKEIESNKDLVGIIGVNYNSYNENGDGLVRTGHHIGSGWGCIMFIKKEYYIPIPDDLKIWYGDLWLANKLKPYNIFSKSRIFSEISTTSESGVGDIDEIIKQDKVNWLKYN